jgi:cholesterol oxidase
MDRPKVEPKESPLAASGMNRREMINASTGLAVCVAAAIGSQTIAPISSSSAQEISEHTARETSPLRKPNSPYKQTAVQDHAENMREFGGSLSTPIDQLINAPCNGSPNQFDVLIIGSGYGGAICAARLAPRMRPGHQLCVLERGKEWVPGTFPDRLPEITDNAFSYSLCSREGQVKNPIGLFNTIVNDEINVLSGCGVGGGSLINANVAIRPDREVFEQSEWPVALRNRDFLEPYFDLAACELNVITEPACTTDKMKAQCSAGENLRVFGGVIAPADLTVMRDPRGSGLPVINRQGLRGRSCMNCGDCTTGCNAGSKNTLAMNYLPLAKRAGAKIFSQTEVTRIQKLSTGYRVYFRHHVPTKIGFDKIEGSVTARIVIVSAGSVGSTEILLRSWAPGFEISPRIGFSWTGNGDALGFVRKSDFATNIGGHGAFDSHRPSPGPTIQTNLTYPHRSDLSQRILIQDGSVARAYATILGGLMQDLNLSNTMSLLGMGHDGSQGRITLRETGYAQVLWPGLKESAYRRFIRSEFDRVAQAHGGEYKFLKLFGDNFISVHPLGGCNMADDPAFGVVNDKGQLFDGDQGGYVDSSTGLAAIHEGLYVADGSIIPRSIACNPFLTISALSERIAEKIVFEPKYRDLFV